MLNPYTEGELDAIEAYLETADVRPVGDACARQMAGRLLSRLRATKGPGATAVGRDARGGRLGGWPRLWPWPLAGAAAAAAAAVAACALLSSGFRLGDRRQVDSSRHGTARVSLVSTGSTASGRVPEAGKRSGVDARAVPFAGLVAANPPGPLPPVATPGASAAARAGPAAVPAARTTDYVLREGDTFGHIAQREYGKSSVWPVIAAANPDVDPERLRPGRKIKLPTAPVKQVRATGKSG